MKTFTVAAIAGLSAVVSAQDLGALLSSCASQQFQQLGLTGVDGDPCKSEAGQPSYYKCSCTRGQDFVINYLCKNPGSCTPDDIPGLTDTLVKFCQSVGVTVTAPQNPCGLAPGGGSSSAAPSSAASAPASSAASSAPSSAASSAASSRASTPAGTPAGTPVGTPTTPTTPAGTPAGTPASYTGAAAVKNVAGGLAGVAGLAGLLVL